MLHDKATAYSLGIVRIWVFGLAALSRLLTPAWEACLIPEYQPAGIMRVLGAQNWVPLITLEMAYCIQALTIGLLLIVAVGMGPYRLLAPLACLALTLTEGMVRSNGVMTHANLILILCTYVLAMFPAADALTLFHRKKSPTKPQVQYQAALISLSLVFCITYFFVGVRRLVDSGFDIYFDDSILCATALRDAEQGPAGGLGIRCCESVITAWAIRIGFPLVTLFELLTPLCIFSKRVRWIWLVVMIPFHLGTGLMMGIWFIYNIALIPVLIAGFDPSRSAVKKHKAEQPEEADSQAMKLAA
jgi:Vitamin K-dependent gamma-carboxylase